MNYSPPLWVKIVAPRHVKNCDPFTHSIIGTVRGFFSQQELTLFSWSIVQSREREEGGVIVLCQRLIRETRTLRGPVAVHNDVMMTLCLFIGALHRH